MRTFTDTVSSTTSVAIAAYMVYATVFGPYKTTIVHLALFLMAMLAIYFLRGKDRADRRGAYSRVFDWGMATASVAALLYVVFEWERLIGLWGAAFLTRVDLMVGGVIVVVVLEAARRESFAFFLLSLASILYIFLGDSMIGVLRHPGMDLDRFIYLTAFTGEGVFGLGLDVAASYLFMFMLLSSALDRTKTGDLVMKLSNALVGAKVGGPAKAAVFASAGLGTMIGSSIGNVISTGTFTIPMMKRAGIVAHKAAAIETTASEGSQILPPVMGTAAFIMAEFTGIPYAAIALAAVLPALLYFVSLYIVVHIESVRIGLLGVSKDELPSARQALREGWHLLVAPLALFYLLLVEQMSPGYAGMISAGLVLAISTMRTGTRMSVRDLHATVIDGVRIAAGITALITAVGFVQQALVTTGLAPRLTDIILAASSGSMLVTLMLAVVVATLLGMGLPTPIAYVMLALFVAPAMERAGVPTLPCHLFLFYFAVKSGSTPPVAVTAMVAAGIANANWWLTGVYSFLYAIPGFIVAFMFVYSPPLLLEGSALDIAVNFALAVAGVVGIAAGLQGWLFGWIGWVERALLVAASILLIRYSLASAVVGGGILVTLYIYRRFVSERRRANDLAAAQADIGGRPDS
ncbi:MAG: TRAP transporter fused permease subunit [Burkholderiaceae bacterium]|nr:TRAP transporter fused permease subunit [Burkholderiaceae bacterium]